MVVHVSPVGIADVPHAISAAAVSCRCETKRFGVIGSGERKLLAVNRHERLDLRIRPASARDGVILFQKTARGLNGGLCHHPTEVEKPDSAAADTQDEREHHSPLASPHMNPSL